MNVREIIREATSRINLVPRKQAVPGNIVENALNLLNGIVSRYNKDNLLSFTENSVTIKNPGKLQEIHIYDQSNTAAGPNNMVFDSVDEMNAYEITQEDVGNGLQAMTRENTNVVYNATAIHYGPDDVSYTWIGNRITVETKRVQDMKAYMNMIHFKVPNVFKVSSLYLINPNQDPLTQPVELQFVPAKKFDAYVIDAPVYTFVERSQGEWIIKIKKLVANYGWTFKMDYNEGIKFDEDSELFVPDNYIELLNVSLAHELAIMYPRLDEAQMNRLEKEVATCVNNVRTPKAEAKRTVREDYFGGCRGPMTQAELLSGAGIFG